jgi:hypothetical protein
MVDKINMSVLKIALRKTKQIQVLKNLEKVVKGRVKPQKSLQLQNKNNLIQKI